MHKIVKFDFKKLEVGMEVFDILTGWEEILVLKYYDSTFPIKLKNGKTFDRHGKFVEEDRMPTLVAMKVPLEVEDVPTKEFVLGEKNYEIIKFDFGKWSYLTSRITLTYKGDYYTEENAELICKILNKEMK